MKKIFAGFAGIALAVSLTACSDGDSEPTATETVTVAPTPEIETPETETEAPEADAGQVPDVVFTGFIRENTNAFDLSSDEDIIAITDSVCGAFDNGSSKNELFAVVAGTGVNPRDAGFLIGAGVANYCPEHAALIDGGANS